MEFQEVDSGREMAVKFKITLVRGVPFPRTQFGKVNSERKVFCRQSPGPDMAATFRESWMHCFDGKHFQEVLVSVTAGDLGYVWTHSTHTHTHQVHTQPTGGSALICIKNTYRLL